MIHPDLVASYNMIIEAIEIARHRGLSIVGGQGWRLSYHDDQWNPVEGQCCPLAAVILQHAPGTLKDLAGLSREIMHWEALGVIIFTDVFDALESSGKPIALASLSAFESAFAELAIAVSQYLNPKLLEAGDGGT